MNSLLVSLSAFLLAAPQAPPTGNVGSAPGGNVGRAPGGNVGVAPGGNVGRAPSGNVGRAPGGNVGNAPGGNVGRYPGGNVDRYPGGNVGVVPPNPMLPKSVGPSRVDGKGKSKNNSNGDSKSKKGSGDAVKAKKDADRRRERRPGVTGPIVVGATIHSGGIVADLEQVRRRLNTIGNDYQGRRATAVIQVTHAIHMLRVGQSDPNAQAAFVPAVVDESQPISDDKMRIARAELERIAGRLRTNAYFHSSAALAAVERAMNAISGAVKNA